MLIRVLVRMRCQFQRRARPVRRDHAGLHLRKRPWDGFGVEQQEGQRGVWQIKDLMGIEVVNALAQQIVSTAVS